MTGAGEEVSGQGAAERAAGLAAGRPAGAGDLTRRSHDYWAGRAREYSDLHERELESERGRAFEMLFAGFPFTGPGVRALDLGCGSGLVSIALACAGCEVTGVDFSEEMLEQARANAARHGAELHGLRRMDVHSLDFPDGSFDLVATRNVTWVLEDVPQVYREALRVLRPGGTLVNMDADYGRATVENVRRGYVPQHPTQTPEQLRERDRIVVELPVSHVERPLWDVRALWELGVSRVSCYRDLDALLADALGGGRDVNAVHAEPHTQDGMFMLVATK